LHPSLGGFNDGLASVTGKADNSLAGECYGEIVDEQTLRLVEVGFLALVANYGRSQMKRALRLVSSLGCLISVVGPFLAVILYPRAKWLFAFVLIGFAVLWLNRRFAKDPTPQALADQIERLLTGNYAGWEVDDFEMQSIRNSQLRDLHSRCMNVGLPEEWPRLNEEQKNRLREIIVELRGLGDARKQRQPVN
jgi:hypothetical protein